MFQNQTKAASGNIGKQEDYFFEISTMKKIVFLVGEWSELFETAPSLHVVRSKYMLNILFENACFDCDELIADYGIVIASIAKKYDISICGIIKDLEIGEITTYFDNDKLCYTKSNVSGKNFDSLSSVYIRIILDNAEEFDFIQSLLLRYKKSGISFSRKYKKMLNTNEFFGERELTHFLYLELDNDIDIIEMLPEILTLEQMTELWILFLEENFTAVEFDIIYERIGDHDLSNLIRLELSLQLALSQLDIQITNDTLGFKLHKANGERIKFDFSSDSTAEKLFVKILFPISR